MPGVHYLEDTARYAQCTEPPTLTLPSLNIIKNISIMIMYSYEQLVLRGNAAFVLGSARSLESQDFFETP